MYLLLYYTRAASTEEFAHTPLELFVVGGVDERIDAAVAKHHDNREVIEGGGEIGRRLNPKVKH